MNAGLSAVVDVESGARELPVRTAVSAASAGGFSPVQVDFANVFREHLFLFGWILGLWKYVSSATVRHGDSTLDLLQLAVLVPRADVTKHFAATLTLDNDDHGFCLLVPLTDVREPAASVTLSVILTSGEAFDSHWSVVQGESALVEFFRQNQASFKWLLARLGPGAAPLREVVATAAPSAVETLAAAMLPIEFDVSVCCLLGNHVLLVAGSMADSDQRVTSARIVVGSLSLDVLAGAVFAGRPVGAVNGTASDADRPARHAFTCVFEIGAAAAAADKVLLNVVANGRQSDLRRPLVKDPMQACGELVDAVGALDGDSAIALIERVVALLDDSAPDQAVRERLSVAHRRAAERLPISIESVKPRIFLHLDGVIPIAEDGIFLQGWCNAEASELASVVCHNGFTSLAIDRLWVRHPRVDVAEYLLKVGINTSETEHGYSCFIPLQNKQAPYLLAVTSAAGVVRRLRIQLPVARSPALQTVREVLSVFTIQHRRLRELLDRHVGPAVRVTWAKRDHAEPEVISQHFGPQPSDPALSIIVPLFGRHDLAEYQMALFADDPEFRNFELIYFVDDPAIYDEFRFQCADLYEIYRVSFTVAFGGFNLGFAGANNCAARMARGRHLLLLNSDVFPKSPGWAGAMLKVYGELDEPGVLGIKLLYEDGSVQHAGMSFRRHASWSDLWINHHPYKGQSAVGLTGVHEVDAVTAACALIDRDLYRRLGGLSEDYIIGDFEDSDLCLRARSLGRRNRVSLDIEMYHLERQSQNRIGDSQWRTNLSLYNCWEHQQRWGEFIAERAS